jgi:hypothetical protein
MLFKSNGGMPWGRRAPNVGTPMVSTRPKTPKRREKKWLQDEGP